MNLSEAGPRVMPKKKGMTLIELVLVMALVVTLASLATVSFVRSYQARSFNHYVNEFASYLRYLQFKAIEEGIVLKLAPDPETETLRCYVKKKKSSEFSESSTSFSKRFESKGDFEVGIRKDREVYFYPDGTITLTKFVITNKKNDEEAVIEVKNRLGAFKVTFDEQTRF